MVRGVWALWRRRRLTFSCVSSCKCFERGVERHACGGCLQPASQHESCLFAAHHTGWSFEATNNFVDCSSTPITGEEFHLPTITNDTTSKTVRTTTYSQCQWATGDGQDTGFVYTSASEIGTKLSSRQCLMIEGLGLVDTSFDVDDPDFCMMANQKVHPTVGADGTLPRRVLPAHAHPPLTCSLLMRANGRLCAL